MQQNYNRAASGIISMEEYLSRRQEIREKEQKKEDKRTKHTQEKTPGYIMAELFI